MYGNGKKVINSWRTAFNFNLESVQLCGDGETGSKRIN
jgi:hypothetical protein